MNDHTAVKTGDNASQKFKEFNGILDEIERSLLTAQDHLKRHDHAVFDAIGSTLDLGHLFAEKRNKKSDKDWSFLKDFVGFHDCPWTAKCENNIFHALVTVGFDKVDEVTGKALCSQPQLSKYRTILRYAFEQGMSGAALVTELKKFSLSEFYEQAVSVFRFDPLDHFVEDDEQRYVRASTQLLEMDDLPNGEFTTNVCRPEKMTGFIPAMIHVDDDGFKLVGVFEDEPATIITQKVSSLVPAEAKRSRQKLAVQSGYLIYAACDLYTRFLPRIADVLEWRKAAEVLARPVLTHESSDEEVAAYMAWVENGGLSNAPSNPINGQADADKKSGSLDHKFKLLDALRFAYVPSGWMASNVTTLPHTPCCEIRFPESRSYPHIDPLSITSLEAKRLVSKFPRHSPWQIVREKAGLTLRSQSDATVELLAADLDNLTNWRSLDQDLKSVARFEVSKGILNKLDTWKAEFRDSTGHGRSIFQRYHLLEVVDDQLQLVLPDRDGHRRTIGTLISDETLVVDVPRFFDFNQVQQLIQFAFDYGISYEFDLLKGHQGLSALRVSFLGLPFDASVTLPLMLSQKGNPVEITLPLRAGPALQVAPD